MIRQLLPGRVKRAIKVLIGPEEDFLPPESAEKLAGDAGDYWSASRGDEATRDMSHWRGTGRWADDELWLRVGDDHFALYESLLRLSGRGPAGTMLEWGPGGGANAVRFGREVGRFYGVDISGPNLEKCRQEVEASGFGGFVPVLIDATRPEAVLDQVGEKVDFFLCTAVYQHFPGKEYGVRVTRLARDLLAEGGVALIQTRYDDGHAAYASKSRDYRSNAITFTSYPIAEFWGIAEAAGLRPLAVVLRPATNYAFYFLSKS